MSTTTQINYGDVRLDIVESVTDEELIASILKRVHDARKLDSRIDTLSVDVRIRSNGSVAVQCVVHAGDLCVVGCTTPENAVVQMMVKLGTA